MIEADITKLFSLSLYYIEEKEEKKKESIDFDISLYRDITQDNILYTLSIIIYSRTCIDERERLKRDI